MSDLPQTESVPNQPTPPCPVCGGETFRKPVHKAIEARMNVFQCRTCHVQYPVMKKPNERHTDTGARAR